MNSLGDWPLKAGSSTFSFAGSAAPRVKLKSFLPSGCSRVDPLKFQAGPKGAYILTIEEILPRLMTSIPKCLRPVRLRLGS